MIQQAVVGCLFAFYPSALMTEDLDERLSELPDEAQVLLANYRDHWDEKLAREIRPLSEENYREIFESFYELLHLSLIHI